MGVGEQGPIYSKNGGGVAVWLNNSGKKVG